MRLQQLKHYNPRASSGFQSSIDCGNLNFSSLWEARLYRSTSCIDKLLKSVLGAITDRQTILCATVLCDVGLGLEIVLRGVTQVISYEISIPNSIRNC
jgi:hypothetical protein